MTGLLESKAMKDKPIWYNVYKEHPPKYNPTFVRPIQDIKVKQILYEEDRIRAQLHKKIRLTFNLAADGKDSRTKNLINKCKKLMEEESLTVAESVAIVTEKKYQSLENSKGERNNVNNK